MLLCGRVDLDTFASEHRREPFGSPAPLSGLIDPRERLLLSGETDMHWIQMLLAAASIACSLVLLAVASPNSFLNSLPMWIFALSSFILPMHWSRVSRRLRVMDAKSVDAHAEAKPAA